MSMREKGKKKLNQLINKTKERYKYLSDSLGHCELDVDEYPSVYARCSSKTVVNYVFRTNDQDSYECINNDRRKLANLCNELLDSSDELQFDEDGEPMIEIKFVDEDLDVPASAPKITFDDCLNVVLKNIEKAKISIIGAVAWLTNKTIVNALVEKANQGILIKFIADRNAENERFRDNNLCFKELNFPVFYVKSLKKDYWGNDGTMHLKFAVIDSSVVLYGTFNWSEKAAFNNEDIHEDNNSCNIQQYIDEFQKLIEEHKCYLKYEKYYF